MPKFEVVPMQEAVVRSATGVRAQMAKQYLQYIENLGENQAGKLQVNPDERIGTVRRRLNYAAKLAGKSLTIKPVGDELYFWVQTSQAERPRRLRTKDRYKRPQELNGQVSAAVVKEGDRIKIHEHRMVPNRVYEVSTSQGPVQFIKRDDGIVNMYEIFDLPEGQDASTA